MQCVGCEGRQRQTPIVRVVAFFAVTMPLLLQVMSASADTLDKIKASGAIALGYRVDARPFSYRDESGSPAGYSVQLCERIAEQVKTQLGLPSLKVNWVPVTLKDRFTDVQQGKIDLLCGADSVTLERRKQVAFSIPIFPGGIGAVLRADAPAPLLELLAEGKPLAHPIWRGSPARTILEKKTFSAVAHTTSESWLADRLARFELDASTVAVDSYDAGIQDVLDRRTDVLFGDLPILMDAVRRSPSAQELVVLKRTFTYESLAIALAHGDEDLRLLVDQTLSRLFRSEEFRALYTKWFGEPDSTAAAFFLWGTLPE